MDQWDIKDVFSQLKDASLSEQTATFVKSLKRWYKKTGKLSDKQIICLRKIYNESFTRAELNHKINSN